MRRKVWATRPNYHIIHLSECVLPTVSGKTAVRVSAGCGQAMCECMRPIHSYTHRLIIIIVMNSERNAYDDKHVIIHGTETETIIGTAAAT